MYITDIETEKLPKVFRVLSLYMRAMSAALNIYPSRNPPTL